MRIKDLLLVSLFLVALGILFYVFFLQDYSNRKLMKTLGITSEQSDKIARKDEIATKSKNFNIKNVKVYDLENDEFPLKELLDNKPKVILKYSGLQCSYCIEHSLNYLYKYENIIGLQNIIILVEFRNEHDFLIFRQMDDIHPRTFGIYTNLALPVDGLDLPYILVTDSLLTPTKIFIPLKEFPERTNQYFKKEILKYFKNNSY